MSKIFQSFFKKLGLIFLGVLLVWGAASLDVKQVEAAASYSSFSDISNNHWAFWYAEAAYQAEFTRGCAENPLTFCPDSPITRRMLAAFIVRAKNISLANCNQWTATFRDVPRGAPLFCEVEGAYRAGLLNGIVSGSYFNPDSDAIQSHALRVVYNATGRQELPARYLPAYNATASVNRAQLFSMMAWNFNLSATLSGQTMKVTIDSSGQPVSTEDPLPGAVVKFWYDGTTTNPDFILRSDENGNYSVNLDLRRTTNNLKIISHDPDKIYPSVTVGQQIAQSEPLIKKAHAENIISKVWKLLFKKKSDCATKVADRIINTSRVEKQYWNNLFNQKKNEYINQLKQEHPDWTTEQITDEAEVKALLYIDPKLKTKYTGSPKAFCCTGFVTWVATKSGLVKSNGKSFFYTDKTILPVGDRRVVGASTLREWFIANNGKTLVASDGNKYKVVFNPKSSILQNLSLINIGQVYLKLPPGGGSSGHSAFFTSPADPQTKKAGTINCDGPFAEPLRENLFIQDYSRDLTQQLFYGSGSFECQN